VHQSNDSVGKSQCQLVALASNAGVGYAPNLCAIEKIFHLEGQSEF